jgi:hypothetical protein
MPTKQVDTSEKTNAKLIYTPKSVLLNTSVGVFNLDELLYIGPIFSNDEDEELKYYITQFKQGDPHRIPKTHFEQIIKEAQDFEIILKEGKLVRSNKK